MNSSAKIKVWLKEPEKKVRHVWISPRLENLQKTVGGYVEAYFLSPHVAILCNEEGKLRNLPHNVDLEGEQFVGTIIFVGVKGEDFSSCPWELDEIKKYYPQLFKEKEDE